MIYMTVKIVSQEYHIWSSIGFLFYDGIPIVIPWDDAAVWDPWDPDGIFIGGPKISMKGYVG